MGAEETDKGGGELWIPEGQIPAQTAQKALPPPYRFPPLEKRYRLFTFTVTGTISVLSGDSPVPEVYFSHCEGQLMGCWGPWIFNCFEEQILFRGLMKIMHHLVRKTHRGIQTSQKYLEESFATLPQDAQGCPVCHVDGSDSPQGPGRCSRV